MDVNIEPVFHTTTKAFNNKVKTENNSQLIIGLVGMERLTWCL